MLIKWKWINILTGVHDRTSPSKWDRKKRMRGSKYIKQLNDCESELMMLFLMNLQNYLWSQFQRGIPMTTAQRKCLNFQGVTKGHVSLDAFIMVKLVQKSLSFLYNFIIFIFKSLKEKAVLYWWLHFTILRQNARFGLDLKRFLIV